MLKHKLKQWLSDHQPEVLRGIRPAAEPSSPTSMTPPLRDPGPSAVTAATTDVVIDSKNSSGSMSTVAEKSPSDSAVNQYPSLKSKILGLKMGVPASKESLVGGAGASLQGKSYASTTNLAAAAALATGLHSKRKREDAVVKPSPIKIVRVKEEFDGEKPDKPATTTSPSKGSKPPSSQSTVKSTSGSKGAKITGKPSVKAEDGSVKTEDGSTEEGTATPPKETDDDIARRLHQELNCAPMRTSRSRRNISCAQEVVEDPVHGQDPGILPSC